MIFLYALPQMMLFVVLSDQWSPGGFIVGYVVGLMVSLLVGARAAGSAGSACRHNSFGWWSTSSSCSWTS
ncbi:hypothetical protein QM565_15035 [Geitlerinema splendidum]|nr:hypothetical protein [Geitlerinema splendidum]